MSVATEHLRRSACVDRFRKAFGAQAARRRDVGSAMVGGEIAWVVAERELMLGLVNRERAKEGMPPVDEETFVRRVENPAVGHADYAGKLCLYAADMAMTAPPRSRTGPA